MVDWTHLRSQFASPVLVPAGTVPVIHLAEPALWIIWSMEEIPAKLTVPMANMPPQPMYVHLVTQIA